MAVKKNVKIIHMNKDLTSLGYTGNQKNEKPLEHTFFARPVDTVASDLVGKLLCHSQNGEVRQLRITETEAYGVIEDTACHAYKGKTKRTAVLYETPGTLYVYICYGIHHLLNVVTGNEGDPQAVLIRACESAEGPGRLTKALGITNSYHGVHLQETDAIVFLDDGYKPKIEQLSRVGIAYADQKDIEALRRYVDGNTKIKLK